MTSVALGAAFDRSFRGPVMCVWCGRTNRGVRNVVAKQVSIFKMDCKIHLWCECRCGARLSIGGKDNCAGFGRLPGRKCMTLSRII